MKYLAALIISCLMGAVVYLGLPVYLMAIFPAAIIVLAFYYFQPVRFISFLLLLRPPLDQVLTSIRFGGLGLGGALGFILSFFALLGFFTNPPPKLHKWVKLPLFCFLAFVFLQMAALFYSANMIEALKDVNRTLSIVAVFALVLIHVRNKKDALLVLKGIVFAGILPLLIALVAPGKVSQFEGYRLTGGLGHPNIFAFFALIVVGSIIFGFIRDREKLTHFDKAYLLALVVALVMTKTRSGWIAFFIMMFLTAVRFYRQYLIYLILICVLASFSPMVQNRIFNAVRFEGSRVSENRENSFEWRLGQWKDLLAKGMQRPLTGYGAGGDRRISENRLAAHNDYIGLFVRNGIFAVIAYYLPFFYLLVKASQTLRPQYDELTVKLSKFFVCYIPAFLVMSVSENLVSYVVVHWYFWALVGIYIVSLNWKKVENNV